MIKIIETNEDNILGIEVIGGYSNADVEELIQNIDKKISEGNERLNFLFKIDKIKYGKREFAAFYKDGKSYAIKNLKNIRHIAVVGHSRLEKVLIELDNKIMGNPEKEMIEKYFDVADIEKAWEFVRS